MEETLKTEKETAHIEISMYVFKARNKQGFTN